VVHVDLPTEGWAGEVLHGIDRFAALVIGNGLGTAPATAAEIRRLVGGAQLPTVVDADGLTALAPLPPDPPDPPGDARRILTPHDGEYARLMGDPPAADRFAAARALAERGGAVALLKGSTTVVAHPDGRVLVSTSGDARLATAGTGDVLAGIIGALCALGVEPFEAAAAGAYLHGAAAALGLRHGLVAGDVAAGLPALVDRITAPSRP
jgi:NAD(P)H-hydrate epimerase